MSYSTTQRLASASKERTKTKTKVTNVNSIAYIILGLVFGGFLLLSVQNDYFFFEWLAVGSFIVFLLICIHFIGQKQIKRN